MIFISVVFFSCLNCYYHFSFYSRFIQMSCCFLLKIFFNCAEFHSFCKSQVFHVLMFDFNFYFSDFYWQPFKNKLSNCICFELFRQVMVIISGLLVMSFRATRFQHYLFFFIIFQTIILEIVLVFPLVYWQYISFEHHLNFCSFVAKLRCFQLFCTGERFWSFCR